MEAFYYNQMNKIKQAVYHNLMQCALNLGKECQVPLIDPNEVYDVFFKMRLDHPEIFWFTDYKAYRYPDSPNLIIKPEYMFDKGKVAEHQKAMKTRVDKLARGFKGKTELENELYIHDFLCENVHYDKLKKDYSHEIIGPLGHGVGVCEGIAKSVKVLCDALGLWCIIAICDNNPEKGLKYRHAWNIVKIDGKYYHLDATFDNSLTNKDPMEAGVRYDYFNLDDKKIFRDHEPLMYKVPACTDSNHFYYLTKKLSFTKEEDVYKRMVQIAKKGKVMTFHWRGGYLSRDVLNRLLELIRQAGAEKGKSPKVLLNWPQAVLRVGYFQDAESQIVMEEANEGEEYCE